MKDSELPVTDDELHAYVDGELPADRRAAVEAWLAAHPDDAARVAAWRLQADAIRAHYPMSPGNRSRRSCSLARMTMRHARGSLPPLRASSWHFSSAASSAGWHATASSTRRSAFEILTAQALNAHKLYAVEVRHPVEVAAADAEHLQQWLSKRVGYPLRAPNLEPQGLQLVGGRLLPTPTGAAAAFFMYENPSGERFTLYCAPTKSPNSAMHYNAAEKAGAIYWVDSNVAYVVSSAGERKQLWKVARAAYEQIEPRVSQQDRGS